MVPPTLQLEITGHIPHGTLVKPLEERVRCNSEIQKESGQKVLSFSWNLAVRGNNDTHYEIIGVDISTPIIYIIYI